MQMLLILSAILAGLILLAALVAFVAYFQLWVRAVVTRTRIGLPSIVFMSFRQVRPKVIVDAQVMATQAGLALQSRQLESHFLAGGNVDRVVRALIAAQRANISLEWETASAIDLAGRNVLDAVQMSVSPRVIDCPQPNTPGGDTLDGVAKDGIQLKVQARVTVRANLQQLVGGATEETVVARVGEGIVSAIGSAETHKHVLAHPQSITARVLERGLDSQTAFEIVSIDISHIDVGDNIGARLRIEQAAADVRVARAKAEERRARATAAEQEMVALTAANRAKVVEAEAEVPSAAAEACLNGCMRVLPRNRGIRAPRIRAAG